MKNFIELTPSFIKSDEYVKNSIRVIHSDGSEEEIYWIFQGGNLPSRPISDDYALIATLPMAMHLNKNIILRGCVTRSLLESIEECIDVWTSWLPDLFKSINIQVNEIIDDRLPAGRDAVMMFSGGVDATFSLVAHKRGILGHRSYDIKTAVLVHGFDIPIEKPQSFESALAHSREILNGFDTKLLPVKTNWRDFCVDWQNTHGFGLAAVLHQFNSTHSIGLWAADEAYHEEIFPWGNNSVTNPLLSGISFPIKVSGGGYTRSQKVDLIGNISSVRKHIRVCWERPDLNKNCGACEKCIRTQLNFALAGYTCIEAFNNQPLDVSKIMKITCHNEIQRTYIRSILTHQNINSIPPDLVSALKTVLSKTGSNETLGYHLLKKLKNKLWSSNVKNNH